MNYAVLGYGITGRAVVCYLLAQGNIVTIYDENKDIIVPPFAKGVKWVLGSFVDADLLDYDEIILSPGISRKTACIQNAIAHNKSVIGDIELFARINTKPVIGITGTNGKSTVTLLVAKLLEAAGLKVAMGGNFGIPVFDLIATNPDIYVLELSNFQLESTFNLKLTAGTCLNLAPDHMDSYACYQDYCAAKLSIYNNCEYKIINQDDELINRTIKADLNTRYFSLNNIPDFLQNKTLRLRGTHNLANYLAALVLVGTVIEITDQVIHALYDFKGLEHRCEFVSQVNNVIWINDSKGTNVAATQAAIAGISAKIILIAGGIGKDADFTPLATAARDTVQLAILYGRDKAEIAQALAASCTVILVDDLSKAVDLAYKYAMEHRVGIVLFSPACSSYDMFKNYEHRGAVFKDLVEKLYNESSRESTQTVIAIAK